MGMLDGEFGNTPIIIFIINLIVIIPFSIFVRIYTIKRIKEYFDKKSIIKMDFPLSTIRK